MKKPNTKPKPKLVTKTELKNDFGFSPKWIERLGAPDEEKNNPFYRSAGAPMQLWEEDRIFRFICDNETEFTKHMLSRNKRARAALAAAEKARQAVIEWARTVEIEVEDFPPNLEILKNITREHLEERASWKGDFTPIKIVYNQNIINMLRHEYTNYDELWQSLERMVGREYGYQIIRERVDRLVCHLANLKYKE